MWWKQNKWKVLLPVFLLVILTAAFWYGGNSPGMQGWTVEAPKAAETLESKDAQSPDTKTETEPEEEAPTEEEPQEERASQPETGIESRPGGTEGGMSAQEKIEAAEEIAGGSQGPSGDKQYASLQGMAIDPVTGKDPYQTTPVPHGKPVPVEPQDVTISNVAHTCTLSIRCDAILANLDWLDPNKTELVPADGVIFPTTTVTFYEGESVFNLLQREMKKAGVHMEFENPPIYNSAYIEGIANLYEFDCGELSGWMYKVNDWFPNYGCSRYQLKEGDVVEWVYTCNLGIDVGGYSAPAG